MSDFWMGTAFGFGVGLFLGASIMGAVANSAISTARDYLVHIAAWMKLQESINVAIAKMLDKPTPTSEDLKEVRDV